MSEEVESLVAELRGEAIPKNLKYCDKEVAGCV